MADQLTLCHSHILLAGSRARPAPALPVLPHRLCSSRLRDTNVVLPSGHESDRDKVQGAREHSLAEAPCSLADRWKESHGHFFHSRGPSQ